MCSSDLAMSIIVVYVSVDCAIVKVTKFVLVVEVVVRYGVGIASVCRVVVSDIDRARRAEAWTEPQSCCWRTEMMNNDMQRRLQKVGHYGPCLRRPFVRSFWRGWIAALLRSHHPRLCASSQCVLRDIDSRLGHEAVRRRNDLESSPHTLQERHHQ